MTGRTRFTESAATRLALLILVGTTVWAFSGVLFNDFVDWDDDYILLQNTAYRGFGWDRLRWMFTTVYAGHYQPLTWLSYALDFKLWGEAHPFGFHLTHLLLHVLTGTAFYFVARRLLIAAMPRASSISTGFGALLGTLLFAIHPLRVESVAWATERRDVLAGLWLMIAVLFYLKAIDATPSPRRRVLGVAALLCYSMSLLSKASGMTLPLVLLLLDVYPLRRWSGWSRSSSKRAVAEVSRLRLLREKLPYFVLALVVAGLALWAQSRSGALRAFDEHSACLRIGQAAYGIIFYLVKSICPVALIPLYEQRPNATATDPANLLSAFFVIGVSLLLWRFRRQWPAPAVAWASYLILLAPVLGFAQSGPQVVADRYSYFSCMPWAILVGGLLVLGLEYFSLWSGEPRASARAAQPGPNASQQSSNRYTKMGIALEHAPQSLSGVGGSIRPAGFLRVRRWRDGLLLVASITVVLNLACLTRRQVALWKDSYTLWTTLLDRAPHTGTAHANLAALLNRRGDPVEACDHSRRALEILPGNRVAHIALARCSETLGDFSVAEEHYRMALRIRPDDPSTTAGLARALETQGKLDDAERLYRRLIENDARESAWQLGLAGLLVRRHRDREAAEVLRVTVLHNPGNLTAQFRFAVILMTLDEPREAVATLEYGLRYTPDDPALNAELALILATSRHDELRDGPRAVQLAQLAMADEREIRPLAQEALAAAQAEIGEFDAAAATLEQLLARHGDTLAEGSKTRLRAQLDDYRNHRPLHR